MSRKFVIITSLIMIFGTLITVALLYSTDDEVTTIYEENRKITQNIPGMSVQQIIQDVEGSSSATGTGSRTPATGKDPLVPQPGDQTPSTGTGFGADDYTTPNPNDPTLPPPIDKSSWINCAVTCHLNWGHSGTRYKRGGKATLTDIYTGEKYTIRTDCSGYLSFCLYQYTGVGGPTSFTSGSLDQMYQKYGLTKMPSGTTPQRGDICVYSGHIEIYWDDAPGNGRHSVLNWGDTTTLNKVYKDGHYDMVPYSNSKRQNSTIVGLYRFT